MKYGSSGVKTVEEYLAEIQEPKRSEMVQLDALIRRILPDHERLMFAGIIGYGPFHYKYPSGREGDWYKVGLVANKTGISVYVMAGDKGGYLAEQAKPFLGKAVVGKSCIRFKKLSDLNLFALEELLQKARPWDPS